MTTPIKSFSSAVQEQESPPIGFAVEGDWGKEEFSAQRPGEGTLMLFMAYTVDDSEDSRGQVLQLLRLFEKILGAEGFKRFRKLIDDGHLAPSGLINIFEWLMEQWADFPTQPSSDSPTSRPKTGARSTGRVHGKGSTQPASPSAGS